MESNQRTSSLRDDAPNNGKSAVHTTPTAGTPASTRSTEVSASTSGLLTSDDDTNTSPPVPPQRHQSQNLAPVGMMPQNTNQSTSALFTQQPPETNGILATNHSYAHYAPHNSTQQQQSHPLSPPVDDEELMSRALYEVQRQLHRDIDPSPQPAHWPNQFDQNHDAGLIIPYESPAFHNLYPTQAATQSLQNAFAQDQTIQQSLVMAKRQSPTFPTQPSPRFDRYEHGQPVQYHHPNGPGHLQTSEIPSQTRLQSHSQSPASNDLPSLTAKEQNKKKQSKKRQRRDSPSQLKTQPKQIGGKPAQKRPRRELQTQSKSQDQESPRGVSNAIPPQLARQYNPTIAPALGDSAFDAEPAKRPSTISAQIFHTRAKRLLTASKSRYTTPPTPEREIAYDIASTLMLTHIYLDSKSNVHECAAWLEWAFCMEGIWKRRPIGSIPHAVPAALLRKFEVVYGNRGKVPVFDGDGRVVLDSSSSSSSSNSVEKSGGHGDDEASMNAKG